MELQDLKMFQMIAAEKSISKAATKLHLAQPSLSAFLKKLESEVGQPLFSRSHSGVQLTRAGRMFLSAAIETMQIFDDLQNNLNDLASLQKKRIIFGAPAFRGTLILPEIIQKFHQTFPGIEVMPLEKPSKSLELDVAKGRAEIALVLGPVILPNIRSQFIIQEEVYLVCHRDNPIAKFAKTREDGEKYLNINDTLDQQFILLENGRSLREVADDLFMRANISPAVYTVNSVTMSIALVRKNIGITLCSRMYFYQYPELLYFSIGRKGIFRDLYLIYPEAAAPSESLMLLSDLVTAYVVSLIGSERVPPSE